MTAEAGAQPTKASLKAWWNHFTFAQRPKKDADLQKGAFIRPHSPISRRAHACKAAEHHLVFGKPLRDSLKFASVQISTANANGELYVWGYIPVVVAKWCVAVSSLCVILAHRLDSGLYLKENATEVEGTFRVNGSNKRMRELQALFETPPRVRISVASDRPLDSFFFLSMANPWTGSKNDGQPTM